MSAATPNPWWTITEAGGWAVGPVWRRNADGGWLLPSKTLGWQAIDWCAETLLQPDGERAGEPWEFSPEQLRAILWWYAVDARGRFVYRDGCIRRMKGWGKDPFVSALAWLEFLGPCRFGGWDADGEPVAIPVKHPWVQILGVSYDGTRNTTEALRPMIGGKDRARSLGVDLGIEVSRKDNGRGRLDVVTSSPTTLEGNRPTFALLGETHLWTPAQRGPALAQVVRRNLAKIPDGSARAMSITNAHEPGELSVAEEDHDTAELMHAGRTAQSDFFYDSLEAPPDIDLSDRDSIMRAVVAARGDSDWINPERLADQVLDPRTPVSLTRRFYLNQIVAADDALFDQHHWLSNTSDERPRPRDSIVMFFDGSWTEDTTALVGCRISDGLLFVIGHWIPADLGGEVPRREVEAAVAAAFDRYDILAFWADVRYWESHVDAWGERYGRGLKMWAGNKSGRDAHAVAWDMRGHQEQIADACERFVTDVLARECPHDGGTAMARHVANARRRPNRWGFTVSKGRDDSRKIDLAVCAIMARYMRRLLANQGLAAQRRRYSSASF
jgi:hypothetical protein